LAVFGWSLFALGLSLLWQSPERKRPFERHILDKRHRENTNGLKHEIQKSGNKKLRGKEAGPAMVGKMLRTRK
jgi:hypothetical protein